MINRFDDYDGFFKKLISIAYDGLFFHIDGQIVGVDTSSKRLFGYKIDKLIGTSMFKYIPVECHEAIVAHMSDETIRPSETLIIKQDGSVIPAEFIAATIMHEQESVRVVALRDLSEIKETQDNLREAELRFKSFVEQLPAITYVCELHDISPNGVNATTYISPQVESILGLTQADWMEHPDLWIKHIHEDDRERVLTQIAASNVTGQSFAIEYRAVTRTGRVVWFRNHASYVRDDTGELSSVHGVMLDITERKEAVETLHVRTEQLQQSQKMEALGRLAGGVAHDFNNLLTAILGYSHLLGDRLQDDEEALRDIGEIITAGDRAGDLTRQLLAFARKEIIRVGSVDLNGVVRAADKLLRRTLGEDVELVTLLGENLGTIVGDESQLSQIVMNLAVNARDAMPRGGKLVLETREQTLTEADVASIGMLDPGDYVLLTVSDTGGGIPKEVQDKIFDPFFTTKGKNGTGLGLSMVYGIVQQFSGHIQMRSSGEEGTTFVIYFPQTEETSEHSPSVASAVDLPSGTETILVIEDEPTVLNLATRFLKSLGYSVLKANSGSDAMRIAAEHEGKLDLVLSDIVMPHMSGPDCVQRLLDIRQDFKILYATGFTRSTIVRNGIEEEQTFVLPKPYSRRDMAFAVRQALDNKGPATKV